MPNKKEPLEAKEESLVEPQIKPKCGIIMPISEIDGYAESHWTEVKEILLEVISLTRFEGDLVSNSDEMRVIQDTIVQNIYFNEMIVCDVSAKNPNVMFELGLRIAFDKPVIIIKDDATTYSFDTSPIEHLRYPTDLNYRRINQFKNDLKNKIEATYEKAKSGSSYLKSFGQIKVSSLETTEVPSQEYIINSLDEIKSRISRIENPLLESISLKSQKAVSRLGSNIPINQPSISLTNAVNFEVEILGDENEQIQIDDAISKITYLIRRNLPNAATKYNFIKIINRLAFAINFENPQPLSHIEIFKGRVLEVIGDKITRWTTRNFN